MKNLLIFICAGILALAVFTACSDDDDSPTEAAATYTIDGVILDASGAILQGVGVDLTGAATASDTTDANGDYEFANLESGDYTVSPTTVNYDFEPVNIVLNNLNQDETADFQAIEGIVGTWVSTGSNIAPLLMFAFSNNIDSIYAIFETNQTYLVRQIDTTGNESNYEGIYTVQKSNVGKIYTITIDQTIPALATVEGMYEIERTQSPHFMQYEVVQTNPPLGTPPLPDSGFGSTSNGAFFDANIQKYIRLQ